MSSAIADADLLTKAVAVASRAPSLHNSQPWRWVCRAGTLELHLDRGRVVRSTDSGGREAVIGCGTMLHHLLLVMLAAGWSSAVERFPDPDDIAHLATVRFSPAASVPPENRARVDAILRRRTDRLPFLAPHGWDRTESDLRAALREAVGDAVVLDVLDGRLRPELAKASLLTEETQRFNSGYQAELYWWTAPFEYSEGIPRSALTSVDESDRVTLNRSFPVEGSGSRRPDVSSDRAQILVLSTPEDSYRDALACGTALSAVLLECTISGLATCPVTHVTELPVARDVVAGLVGNTGVPQVLVRVGRVPQLEDVPPPTPRRDPSDVLRFLD